MDRKDNESDATNASPYCGTLVPTKESIFSSPAVMKQKQPINPQIKTIHLQPKTQYRIADDVKSPDDSETV